MIIVFRYFIDEHLACSIATAITLGCKVSIATQERNCYLQAFKELL